MLLGCGTFNIKHKSKMYLSSLLESYVSLSIFFSITLARNLGVIFDSSVFISNIFLSSLSSYLSFQIISSIQMLVTLTISSLCVAPSKHYSLSVRIFWKLLWLLWRNKEFILSIKGRTHTGLKGAHIHRQPECRYHNMWAIRQNHWNNLDLALRLLWICPNTGWVSEVSYLRHIT